MAFGRRLQVFVKRFLIVISLLLILVGTTSASKTYQFNYQKIVEIESPLELTLNNSNGNIIITTNNESKLIVEAIKKIYAEDKEDAELISDHVQISVFNADGHITIEPQFSKIPSRSQSFWQKLFGKAGEQSHGSLDFTISVPTDCNIDIYNSNGDVEVGGIRGRVKVSGSIGNIVIHDIQGNVKLNTTSGQISLKDIEGTVRVIANGSDIEFFSLVGDLEIRNSRGVVKGEYLTGDLIINQDQGDITLLHIDGDIRGKSRTGKIIIGQDFGAIDLTTESGDIEIRTELNSDKDYFVETISGFIRFLIPEASGGKIRMEAGSGNIDAQIPISIDSFTRTRISGSFGNEGPKVTLTTVSGAITLAEF